MGRTEAVLEAWAKRMGLAPGAARRGGLARAPRLVTGEREVRDKRVTGGWPRGGWGALLGNRASTRGRVE